MRFTQAEQALVNKGVQPWKDELREVVESARDSSRNMQEFREKVESFGVRISERTRKRDGETGWTYQHPNGMKCRAAKLGEDYTPSAVARSLSANAEREKQHEATSEKLLAAGVEGVSVADAALELTEFEAKAGRVAVSEAAASGILEELAAEGFCHEATPGCWVV